MDRPYRGSGAAHVVVGCICVAAGIAFAVLIGVYRIGQRSSPTSSFILTVYMEYFRQLKLEWVSFLACSKIWCGFWFVLTGAVGVNVRRKGCTESSYQVLSILNALFWAPGVMVLNALLAYDSITSTTSQYILFPIALPIEFYWLLVFPAVGMFFGLIEFLLSIISSSMVCCCSRTSLPMTHLGPNAYQYEMKYNM